MEERRNKRETNNEGRTRRRRRVGVKSGIMKERLLEKEKGRKVGESAREPE